MRSKRLIGAGTIALVVFVYSLFVTKHPLDGFIAAIAIVDTTVAYSYLEEHGHLPRISERLTNPRSLGVLRLVVASVGTIFILAYAIFITQDPVQGLLALGVFWVMVILTASPPSNLLPE